MTDYTPTPLSYRANAGNGDKRSHWIDAPADAGQPPGTIGKPIAVIFDYGPESAATAARMVKAYNAHDELVAALKAAIADHQFLTPAHTHNCRFCDLNMDDEGTGQDMHATDCWMHKARAALKHATEEPTFAPE